MDLPTLVIQEDHDPYGTLAQVKAIERGVRGSVNKLILKGNGHSPRRDSRDDTTRTILDFDKTTLSDCVGARHER